MASELKVDKITGVTTAGSIDVTGEGNSTTTNLQQGLVKAWAEFTGTGTAAFDDSFNMSSLDDNSTGSFDANFTNPFSGSYSIQFQAIVGTAGYIGNCWMGSDTKTTSNTELDVQEDFVPQNIDWNKVLDIQGNEKVTSYVEDLSTPDFW